MKHHPIDEEFARKLANHRLEPSSKALEKFQERLSQKNKPVTSFSWQSNRKWMYMAASMLVVGSGVLLMINSDSKVTEKKLNNVALKNNDKLELTTQTFKNYEKSIPIVEKNIDEMSVAQPIAAIIEQNIVAEDDTQMTEIVSVGNRLVFEATEDSPKENINQSLFKTDIGESIVLEPNSPAETSILIEEIDADSEMAMEEVNEIIRENEEENRSFISKLFKEYKNLKYGKEEFSLTSSKVNLSETSAPIVSELGEIRDFMQRKIGRLQRR